MNLLYDDIITVEHHDGSISQYTLPGVLTALSTDQILSFPSLRPHQRYAWHSLLVQLGALCCHRQSALHPAESRDVWREWLLALTPDWPLGEAWALVNPNVVEPAFLQAPEPGGKLSGFKVVGAADELDVLATSKNHDVKQAVIGRGTGEQWLFALMSLQTQQGFLGAGNYGICRMNGGFSNRAFFGVRPAGGLGRWFQRDIRELLAGRERLLEQNPAYPATGGLSLVWITPWDGKSSLRLSDLDPWFVEICRRVRLTSSDGFRIVAMVTGSQAARINSKGLAGRTGDPWAPLVSDGNEFKVLTTQPSTFSYRALVPLLFPGSAASPSVRRADMQIVSPEDDDDGLVIIASALVRGQGKTEGFHERAIPVSRKARQGFTFLPSDLAANLANERVVEASLLSREVLYPAALAVFTGSPSPGERKRDDDTAKARARAVCEEFERLVDADFFEALHVEMEVIDDEKARDATRLLWLRSIGERARRVFLDAMLRAPNSAARRYRIRARSLSIFDDRFHQRFGSLVQSPATSGTDHDQHGEIAS